MSFYSQRNRAKANYVNNKFRNDTLQRGRNNVSSDYLAFKLSNSNGSLSRAASKAYSAKRGYDIYVNPKTKQKEMFVRGTTFRKGGLEWVQNALESPVGGIGSGTAVVASALSRRSRRQYSNFLSGVAKKEGVKVIYGHSRGGAVVNDMNVPGARKIGLDAATILNERSKITNIRQRQAFDRVIGLNANATVKHGPRVWLGSKRYHKVYSY